MPDAVGVPLTVIVLAAHVADTPAGKPFAPGIPSFVIPVALTVVCVILVSTVLIHSVGVEDGAVTVMIGVTVIVPVALIAPHPPVISIL